MDTQPRHPQSGFSYGNTRVLCYPNEPGQWSRRIRALGWSHQEAPTTPCSHAGSGAPGSVHRGSLHKHTPRNE